MRLPDDLMRQAKRLAADTDRTLTQLIEDALRTTLARRAHPPARHRYTLPTGGEGGLNPGVDLDDSAALLDLMEGEGPS